MDYFIYQADVICEDCGRWVRANLAMQGKAPPDPDDESAYDSDDFPKGPYDSHFDESDSPQHCGMHEDCVNAMACPTHGDHKVGVFLENRLTDEGMRYVEEACKDALRSGKGCVSLEVWAPFYDISLENDDDLQMGE